MILPPPGFPRNPKFMKLANPSAEDHRRLKSHRCGENSSTPSSPKSTEKATPNANAIGRINFMIYNRIQIEMSLKGQPRDIVLAHILWIGLAAPLFLPINTSATTLVAIVNQKGHKIILATDGLVRHELTGASKQCKLVTLPNCVFGMDGFYANTSPRFDLTELAKAACNSTGPLQSKADYFLRLATNPIVNIVRYKYETDPDYYRRTFLGKPVAEVLFAGYDEGFLSVFARGFVMDNTGSISTETDQISDKPGSDRAFFAGVNEDILAYIHSHPSWETMGDVAAARKFVMIEIQAHPDLVGPPISILEISPPGAARWIEYGKCHNSAGKRMR